jgi:predicted NBD/HSP70 family sugar kinase
MVLQGDSIGQRSETVRRANLSALARDVHGRGTRSRSELGARSGLTRTGIGALVAELAARGLVSEERASPQGTPGRPSVLVQPNSDAAVVLALEIGVDSLAVAVVGFGGRIHALHRVDRPRDRSSVDQTVADLVELARPVRARLPVREALIGIGVAVAGITRRADGFVHFAPNLGWRDVPLGATLSDALGTGVPIAVANDADLGALAEHRRGAAVGTDDVLFISGEVGVGGGLIVDGRPLTGAAGYGGEVGHLPVNPTGLACHCGSAGCWETEVGERALLARAGRRPEGGRGEVDAVLRDAASGDPEAMAALESVGRWLGFGLAGLINVLNPQLVVLGGLFGRIHPQISETLRGELDRRALLSRLCMVRVVPAALGVDAPLLGAAELAFEPLLADPAAWMLTPARRARIQPVEQTESGWQSLI